MEGHHHDWGVGEFDAEEGNDDEDGDHWSARIFRAFSAMKLCAPHMAIADEDNDWRVSEVEADEQMDSWSQAVWPGSSVSQNPKQPRWQVKDFIFWEQLKLISKLSMVMMFFLKFNHLFH